MPPIDDWKKHSNHIADVIEGKNPKQFNRNKFVHWYNEKEYMGIKPFDATLIYKCYEVYKKLLDDYDNWWVVAGKEGYGKCQPKGSKVLMANGEWKNIEDIQKGDYILSPQKDGSVIFSKVVDTTNWFSNENYNVIELNGKKNKLYSCSSNHPIPINSCNKKRVWDSNNIEAKDYYDKTKTYKKNTTTITTPLIKNFKDKPNCDIEPYCLGVWLGDGHFTSPKCRDLGITTSNFEIIEEVSKHYPIMSIFSKKNTSAKMYRFSINGEFSKKLIELGLEGKKSGTKFIPKGALYSDSDYRIKLLAGLIDTDGYLDKRQGYSYCSKSYQLIKDIEFLVYSLGGRGKIRQIKKSIKKLGFTGTYYNMTFYLGKLKLPLKVKKKIRDNKIFYLSPNRKAIDVIPSKPNQVYGIEIEGKSKWYITDNFCVTHNSTIAINAACMISKNFDNKFILLRAEQFNEGFKKATIGDTIVMDEGGALLFSRDAMSARTKFIIKAAMVARANNVNLIVVVPNFYLIDTYIRDHRVDLLLQVKERGCYRGIVGLGLTKASSDGWKYKNVMNVRMPTTTFWDGNFSKETSHNFDWELYKKNKMEYIKEFLAGKEGDIADNSFIRSSLACKELGVSSTTLLTWIYNKKIEAKKLGRSWMIKRSDFDKLKNMGEKSIIYDRA